MMPGVGCIPHVAARAVNCSGVNAGSSVAPRNVHLHVTARRSEAMLSFGIAILGSPLLNLGPVVPDRPLFLPGFIPARRTKTSIMPTLELADRQAQYFGRGVAVDAHRLSVRVIGNNLAIREFKGHRHGRLRRLLS